MIDNLFSIYFVLHKCEQKYILCTMNRSIYILLNYISFFFSRSVLNLCWKHSDLGESERETRLSCCLPPEPLNLSRQRTTQDTCLLPLSPTTMVNHPLNLRNNIIIFFNIFLILSTLLANIISINLYKVLLLLPVLQ